MQKIRIGIVGYGNLGKGVELSLEQNSDMELTGVFTRRDPSALSLQTPNVPVYTMNQLLSKRDEIDVLILCGGSAFDLPTQTKELVENFHVVDSFDTHAKIPEHFAAVDEIAKVNHKIGIISVGWDPGMFSLNRLYSSALLPDGQDYTFWGKGVSQGHSDAIRNIDGVLDARQYTVPVEASVDAVRRGENPVLTTRQKHLRECFVVAQENADLAAIETTIKTMPNYFTDYDTSVTFITMDELKKNHANLPHGGFVIRSGSTNKGTNQHIIEYSLKLDSNPEFTACVLVAYARAAMRLSAKGECGAKTVFDIPPAYLSQTSAEELRAKLL